MKDERAQHEASQNLRIDVENAQHVKDMQRQHATTLESRCILLQNQMKIADKADLADLNHVANLLNEVISIQCKIVARPVSDNPRA